MKIFAMDDCTWYVGETADACAAAYRDEMDCEYEPDDEYPDELDDRQLDALKYQDCDEDERFIGEPRTFREQLAIEIAAGGEFPRLFATSEF